MDTIAKTSSSGLARVLVSFCAHVRHFTTLSVSRLCSIHGLVDVLSDLKNREKPRKTSVTVPGFPVQIELRSERLKAQRICSRQAALFCFCVCDSFTVSYLGQNTTGISRGIYFFPLQALCLSFPVTFTDFLAVNPPFRWSPGPFIDQQLNK